MGQICFIKKTLRHKMGCPTCGKAGGGASCCLCTRGAGIYKWGSKRKICTDCKNREEARMIEYEKLSIRARTLLAGFEFTYKDLEKWKKHWYAQTVKKT